MTSRSPAHPRSGLRARPSGPKPEILAGGWTPDHSVGALLLELHPDQMAQIDETGHAEKAAGYREPRRAPGETLLQGHVVPRVGLVAILWSGVHAFLGLSQQPLTYEMVREAVAGEAPESEHLDWKRQVPSDLDEVAKDVACFANAAGGLLVYGVAENRTTNCAESIANIPVGDAEQRKIRSAVMGRIHPPAQAVLIESLPSETGSAEGVLVVDVHPSRQAPHFVGQAERRLGAPYRSGTQTVWMQEWEIARAYADRARRAASLEEELEAHVSRLQMSLDLTIGPWLVAAGAPSDPPVRVGPPPGKADATAAVDEAMRLRRSFTPNHEQRCWETIETALSTPGVNPRVGLRRWIIQGTMSGDPGERARSGHLELHHDGTVIYAVVADHHLFPIAGKLTLGYPLATGFAADFVSLVETHARRLGVPSPTYFRLDLIRKGEQPVAMVTAAHSSSPGRAEQPSWSRDVRAFQPVTGVLPRSSEPEALRSNASTLARDVTSQFGLE